jgi:hypothetical protein
MKHVQGEMLQTRVFIQLIFRGSRRRVGELPGWIQGLYLLTQHVPKAKGAKAREVCSLEDPSSSARKNTISKVVERNRILQLASKRTPCTRQDKYELF